jgi:hypothetical protein
MGGMRLSGALLVLTACSSSAPSQGAAGTGADGGLTDATTIEAGRAEASSPDGGEDGGPVITNVTITLNPSSALSATLTFTTDRPAIGEANIVNTGAPDNTVDTPLEPAAVTSHSIWLLGMRPSSSFDIAVSATDGAGRTSAVQTTYSTTSLPADFPPLSVVTNDPTKTQPGFLLLNVTEFTGTPVAEPDGVQGSYVVALDQDLAPVWYYRAPVIDPEKLPNGDIVFLDNSNAGWTEIDMMGNTVRTHSAAALGVPVLTHAITPEASGAYLSLVPELRDVPGFPALDGGTSTLAIVGGQSVELPADGGPPSVLADTFDLFNPHTQQGDLNFFDSEDWDSRFPDAGATHDWIHPNAIAVDPSDNNIVSSSYTLSLVYKTDRSTGKLVWALGPGGTFTVTDAGVGQGLAYGEHGSYITAAGTLMCFDDGMARPPTPGCNDIGPAGCFYSRAVEFSLDTTHRTADVVWQYGSPTYGDPDNFYSQIFGNSTLMSGGSVLVNDGCDTAVRVESPLGATNLKSARVFEVTHTTPATKLMELDIHLPIGQFSPDPTYSGFGVYRAHKIPSLY